MIICQIIKDHFPICSPFSLTFYKSLFINLIWRIHRRQLRHLLKHPADDLNALMS